VEEKKKTGLITLAKKKGRHGSKRVDEWFKSPNVSLHAVRQPSRDTEWWRTKIQECIELGQGEKPSYIFYER